MAKELQKRPKDLHDRVPIFSHARWDVPLGGWLSVRDVRSVSARAGRWRAVFVRAAAQAEFDRRSEERVFFEQAVDFVTQARREPDAGRSHAP